MSQKYIILVCFCIFEITVFAQSEIDSLLTEARQASDTIRKIDLINEAAFQYRSINPDSTLILAREGERLSLLVNYPLGLADAKMRIGIGLTSKGEYYSSLQQYLDAKTIYESLNNRNRIASSINNIGRLFSFIGDDQRSLDHYKQASVLFAELKDLRREGSTLNNIGFIYKRLGEYDQSMEYLNKALDRANQLNDPRNILYPTYNIGSVYMLKKESDSAFKYLNHAKELATELRNQYVLSLTLIDLGQAYLNLNQLDQAENNFQEAYKVASSAGMRAEKRDAAKHLSTIYEMNQQMGEALKYYKIFQHTNDSLFNRDLARRMAFQEAEYEFRKQQIREESERRKLELESEKALAKALWLRNTSLAGLACMLLISYLLYMNFSRKRKANEALRKLNKQIEAQAEELKKANHEISMMNSNLEELVEQRTREIEKKNKQLKEYLSNNSHIVRAPLARILGLVDLYEPVQSDNLNFINQNLHNSAKELDNALREINQILSAESDN